MRTAFLLMTALLCFQPSFAQDEPIDFSKVKAPSAPAFSILGTLPNDISRPKSFEELEVSLLSSFTDGNGIVLPDQFALEFSPLWMKSNPRLTFKEATNPSIFQSAVQNLSVSAANGTFPSLKDSTLSNTRMGIGLRTRIDFGTASSGLVEYALVSQEQQKIIGLFNAVSEDAFRDLISTYKASKSEADFENMINWLVNNTFAFDNQNKREINVLEKFVGQLLDSVDFTKAEDEIVEALENKIDDYQNSDSIRNLAKDLQTKNNEIQGAFVEVAFASTLDFPTNQLDFSTIPRYGVWVTPGWKFDDLSELLQTERKLGNIELMVYYRRLWDNYTELETTNNDLGGRFVYSLDKLSLSGEFIYRYQQSILFSETINGITTTSSSIEKDSKVNFTLEYRINSHVNLNYSIGQGFAINNLSGDPGLKAVLGFNYAFGGLTSEKLKVDE